MKCKFLFLCFLMVITLLPACSANETTEQGYSFYYCKSEYQYGSHSSVVTAENFVPVETNNPESLVEAYLNGPISDELVSPFPAGTKLKSMQIGADQVQIILTSEFASLDRIDLTIACACITLTIQNITDRTMVEISADNELLNNQKSIIFDATSLALTDLITSQDPTVPPK